MLSGWLFLPVESPNGVRSAFSLNSVPVAFESGQADSENHLWRGPLAPLPVRRF